MTFNCTACHLSHPASEGAADATPDLCDACWLREHDAALRAKAWREMGRNVGEGAGA